MKFSINGMPVLLLLSGLLVSPVVLSTNSCSKMDEHRSQALEALTSLRGFLDAHMRLSPQASVPDSVESISEKYATYQETLTLLWDMLSREPENDSATWSTFELISSSLHGDAENLREALLKTLVQPDLDAVESRLDQAIEEATNKEDLANSFFKELTALQDKLQHAANGMVTRPGPYEADTNMQVTLLTTLLLKMDAYDKASKDYILEAARCKNYA